MTTPTLEPTELRAGDTWTWTRSLPDYPATTWTLKYRFKHASAAGFEIVASAAGSDFSISVAASASTAYEAGDWTWMSWVEKVDGTKITVGQGLTRILPIIAMGWSPRHSTTAAMPARRWRLSNPGSKIAIRPSRNTRSPGRRMRYIPVVDLLKLRQLYKAEVAAEEAAAAIANGVAAPKRIQFRM